MSGRSRLSIDLKLAEFEPNVFAGGQIKIGPEYGMVGHVGHGLVVAVDEVPPATFTATISGLTGGVALVGTQLSKTASIVPDSYSWLADDVEFSTSTSLA